MSLNFQFLAAMTAGRSGQSQKWVGTSKQEPALFECFLQTKWLLSPK